MARHCLDYGQHPRGVAAPWYRHCALVAGVIGLTVLTSACGQDSEAERLRATSRGAYDAQTGALTLITYDKNQNGVVDTWTEMDGARPVASKLDENEDGVIDRWEEYDAQGKLARAGWVRATLVPAGDGGAGTPADPPPPADPANPPPQPEPDTWAYTGPDGQVIRIEYFDTAPSGDRIMTLVEFYEGEQVARTEEDVNADGAMDKWEVWEAGRPKVVEYDTNADGTRDQRFTYNASGQLILIESAPDATGHYTKRVVPGGGGGRP